MQPFSNGFLPVDTFFVMTGLLVTRSLFRELDNRRRGGSRWLLFNPILFYLRRYVRLTPIYAATFAFIATLSVHCGSGPFWQTVVDTRDSCRATWTSSFLYINNWPSYEVGNIFSVPLKGWTNIVAFQGCMWQTWYLAADMQLFFICPVFVYPLWRWRRAGLVWVLSAVTIAVIVKATVHVQLDLPPTFMQLARP